jgi:hypothetical protein
LALKTAFGTTLKDSSVLTSSKLNGDSRIDYVALYDGDFYLDASGSTNGKYAISSIEIPHVSITPTFHQQKQQLTFDSQTNHLAFKMSLIAGDLIQLDFDHSGWTTLPFTINTGPGNYGPWVYGPWVTTTESTKTITTKTFLANQTGDYFIDVSVPSGLDDRPTLGLTYKRLEIEANTGTQANLAKDNLVYGNISSNADHEWYRVHLISGTEYQFDLKKSEPSSRLNTRLVLRDQNGVQVGVNDDIDWTRRITDSKLLYTPKASGAYYIDVGSYGDFSSGDFTLRFSEVVPQIIVI